MEVLVTSGSNPQTQAVKAAQSIEMVNTHTQSVPDPVILSRKKVTTLINKAMETITNITQVSPVPPFQLRQQRHPARSFRLEHPPATLRRTKLVDQLVDVLSRKSVRAGSAAHSARVAKRLTPLPISTTTTRFTNTLPRCDVRFL